MAKRCVEYQGYDLDISYEILNPTCKNAIVFLHGWGSNKSLMKTAFSKMLPSYAHIYIDMPGFGESPNPSLVLSTPKYTEILNLFLTSMIQSFDYEIDVILGHSYGGKVATSLNPKTLVLLSSAGILLPKSLKVKSKIALSKIAKELKISSISNILKAQDASNLSQNMYETFKIVVNEDFSQNFANFKNQALIFWGKDDADTPLKCGKKIASLIDNATFYEMDGEHYFFLNKDNVTTIEQKLEEALKIKH